MYPRKSHKGTNILTIALAIMLIVSGALAWSVISQNAMSGLNDNTGHAYGNLNAPGPGNLGTTTILPASTELVTTWEDVRDAVNDTSVTHIALTENITRFVPAGNYA